MYKVVRKKALNATVTQMEIEAPLVARKALPGQFIILRVDEDGERIPLTDSQLLNNWQRPALFRLVLTRRDLPLTGEHILRFR